MYVSFKTGHPNVVDRQEMLLPGIFLRITNSGKKSERIFLKFKIIIMKLKHKS